MDDKNKIKFVFTKFFRIKDSIKWLLISFMGFILGLNALAIQTILIPFLVFISTTFFIMCFTFAINNYYDFETDKLNPRRKDINALVLGCITKKTAILLLLSIIIIPLIISLIYRFEVFLVCIFLLFLGWAYSAPPFRTKNIPIIDVIWHFIGFFTYVIWGSIISGSIGLLVLLMAISLGMFSSIGQVGNHINDYDYDKKSKTKTFAVWAGLEKSKKTIIYLTAFHLIILIPLVLFYSFRYYITIIILILLPIIGFIILKPKKNKFPTKRCFTYYFTIVLGGSVYLSILVYQILFLMGFTPIYMIDFI